MTLTIELTIEETQRLQAVSQKTGEPVDQILHQMIAQLPEPVRSIRQESPLTRIFAQWNEEDAAAVEQDTHDLANWEELKGELEANRFNLPIPDLKQGGE